MYPTGVSSKLFKFILRNLPSSQILQLQCDSTQLKQIYENHATFYLDQGSVFLLEYFSLVGHTRSTLILKKRFYPFILLSLAGLLPVHMARQFPWFSSDRIGSTLDLAVSQSWSEIVCRVQIGQQAFNQCTIHCAKSNAVTDCWSPEICRMQVGPVPVPSKYRPAVFFGTYPPSFWYVTT